MIKNFVKGCYSKYGVWLTKRPYVSNMVSTSALMAAGDILAQTAITKDKEKYSPMRTARMAFLGMFFVTPTVLSFYRLLERKLGPNNAMVKVLIDQALFAPCMLLTFMPSLDLLSGNSLDYTVEHIKDDYWSVLKANWMFWPAVQVVNFTLMPLHMRLLVVQAVALMWNTYLAWKLHSHKEKIYIE